MSGTSGLAGTRFRINPNTSLAGAYVHPMRRPVSHRLSTGGAGHSPASPPLVLTILGRPTSAETATKVRAKDADALVGLSRKHRRGTVVIELPGHGRGRTWSKRPNHLPLPDAGGDSSRTSGAGRKRPRGASHRAQAPGRPDLHWRLKETGRTVDIRGPSRPCRPRTFASGAA